MLFLSSTVVLVHDGGVWREEPHPALLKQRMSYVCLDACLVPAPGSLGPCWRNEDTCEGRENEREVASSSSLAES